MPSPAELNPSHRTVYFVRHGQTDWNAQKRLLGRRDIPLNATGQRQAAEAGVCLRWLRPDLENLDFICGPLLRTRQTMAILRAQIGLDPAGFQQDEQLIEIDFGRWEGLTWDQVREQDGSAWQQRTADPAGFVMPGGESYAMLSARVAKALVATRRDVVIVSHGGVCRGMLALLANVDPAVAPTLEIPQNRILMLRGGRFAWLQASTDLKVR